MSERLTVFRDLIDSRLLPYLTEAPDCELLEPSSKAAMDGQCTCESEDDRDHDIDHYIVDGDSSLCDDGNDTDEEASKWTDKFHSMVLRNRRKGICVDHDLQMIASWLMDEADDEDAQFLPSIYYDVNMVKEGHRNGFLVMATSTKLTVKRTVPFLAREQSEEKPSEEAPEGSLSRKIHRVAYRTMKVPVILFKMHSRRCVIDLTDKAAVAQNPPLQRQARKHSNRMTWTIDKEFRLCMEKCHEYHKKQSWLNPVIRSIWLDWHLYGSEKAPRIHSVEVWDQKDNLVAGEIGVAINRVYTSLTGFSFVSGTGHLQLRCVKKLLVDLGYQMLDFGMSMPYKLQYGAIIMDRTTFYQRFTSLADREVVDRRLVLNGPKLIKAYLDADSPATT